MIIAALLNIMFSIIGFVFSLFALPAYPLILQQAVNNVIPWFTYPIILLKTYVGETFFNTTLILIIALVVFRIAFHPAVWLFNKIRGSGG